MILIKENGVDAWKRSCRNIQFIEGRDISHSVKYPLTKWNETIQCGRISSKSFAEFSLYFHACASRMIGSVSRQLAAKDFYTNVGFTFCESNIYCIYKQNALSLHPVIGKARQKESIKRCQSGRGCPQPCEDWNNECVLGERLPSMPNAGSTFWDRGAKMTKWRTETDKKGSLYCAVLSGLSFKGGGLYNNPAGLYVQQAQLPQTLPVSPAWTWADAQVFDSLQRAGIRDGHYLRNPGPLDGGSRVAGLSLALSLRGGGGGVHAGEPGIAHARSSARQIVSGAAAAADEPLGEMGEGKASDWVWRSNRYHTWQCLVWDPVVRAAYVSGWSSVSRSDRVWRVTCHIRPCQGMCLTDHGDFTPAQCFASTHSVRPARWFQVHIWGLLFTISTSIFPAWLSQKYPEQDGEIRWAATD